MTFKRAALTFLGLYVCTIASIVHRHTTEVLGLDIPWAMVLGFVAAYSIARVVRLWTRSGDLFFALGWAIGLTVPMLSPGGSYLIAQDWLGITFLAGGLAALALAIIRTSPHD